MTFRPGSSIKVAGATNSGSTNVDMGYNVDSVHVVNAGSVVAFLACSPTSNAVAAVPTTTAGAGNIAIPGGEWMRLNVKGARYFAAITVSSTADLYVTSGTDSD